MAQYYSIAAGLPELSVDQVSPPISSETYSAEIAPELTPRDRDALELLQLDQLNKRVIEVLLEGSVEADDSLFVADEEDPWQWILSEIAYLRYLGEEELAKPKKRGSLPAYLEEVVYLYYSPEGACLRDNRLLLEDKVTQAYYQYAISQSRHPFLSSWFTFNRNIRNVMAAYVARKLGWPLEKYILGDDPVARVLRSSTAKDFGLGEELEYMPSLIVIAETTDISKRERQLDLLKWSWLDEETFARVFDIDSLLAYYLRLSIIERWSKLSEEEGESRFRGIVSGLKSESKIALDEFKEKQRR